MNHIIVYGVIGMPSIQNIIQTRLNYMRRNINTVTSFLTQPKGVFETVDEVIKNVRMANRTTLQELTGGLSVGAQGKIGQRIRQIVSRFRSRFGGGG